MLLAAVSPLLLPTFPEKAKWLNEKHRIYLFQKLEDDHGHHEREKVTWKTVRHVASDWTLWLQGTGRFPSCYP